MKEFRIQLTFILALEQKFKGDSPSMEEFLNAQKLAEEFAEEYGRTLKLYPFIIKRIAYLSYSCLLYTSDAADEEDSVDLGGRRLIKKKRKTHNTPMTPTYSNTTLHA
eukprot:TRINITY_DN3934_c0_g1_i8.p4 TRINITY_DN3934_c0_g1~~TRINITY_DN3934_c0_g1_i8.p4  ORF type:complete len:108 (-),score=22.79 TRINITY_DN3934_c0_g1_i8:33-356(-)